MHIHGEREWDAVTALFRGPASPSNTSSGRTAPAKPFAASPAYRPVFSSLPRPGPRLDSAVLAGSGRTQAVVPFILAPGLGLLALALGCTQEVAILCVVFTGVVTVCGMYVLNHLLRRIALSAERSQHAWIRGFGAPLAAGGLGAAAVLGTVYLLTTTAGEPMAPATLASLFFALAAGLQAAFSFQAGRVLLRNFNEFIIDLQGQLQDAKLEIHRSRLDPHFVFNTLNAALSDLARDPRAGALALERMESYFRYALKHRHRRWVALGEEFAAARDLLFLEKLRFENELEIDSSLDESVAGAKVPVLILQPLVENAIKHGRTESGAPARVALNVTANLHSVQIQVSNTGAWSPYASEDSAGTGLEGVRYRLRHLYGDNHAMEVHALDGWVHIVITLPRHSGPIDTPIV